MTPPTIEGVVEVLAVRTDIEDLETVIEEFKKQAVILIQQIEKGNNNS